MSALDLDAIEARARRQTPDVPLPRCNHERPRRGTCCYDCYVAWRAAVGTTFEACGRGDVLALVALARATADDPLLDGTDGAHPAWWRGHDRAAEMLAAQRDAATNLLAEVWHEIATGRPPPVSDRTAWLAQVGDVVGAASYCAALAAARETISRERDAARAALRDASRCEACGAWATRYHTASARYGCDSCGVGDGWADDTHAAALRAATVTP